MHSQPDRRQDRRGRHRGVEREAVSPPLQARIRQNYQKWGPRSFDEAAEALFRDSASSSSSAAAFRRGGEVFLDVTQIDTAVDAIKVKLDKIYDDLVSKS